MRPLARRHGLTPEHIILGNGSNDLIEPLVRVLAGGEDAEILGIFVGDLIAAALLSLRSERELNRLGLLARTRVWLGDPMLSSAIRVVHGVAVAADVLGPVPYGYCHCRCGRRPRSRR
jgi:hypothetical protein